MPFALPRLAAMRILALDSSTACSSVALAGPDVPGGGIERSRIDYRRHAEAVPVLVREVLDSAGMATHDIDLVACGVGPGPFTGMRVAIAAALMFAEARSVPVVGVCSLDVIAWDIARSTERTASPLVVVTRARRTEVTWASYDDTGRRIAGPLVAPAPGFEVPPGADVVGDAEGVTLAYPSALALARLVRWRLDEGESLPGAFVVPEGEASSSGEPGTRALLGRMAEGRWLLPPLPIYLRRPDAVPGAGVPR